MIMPGVAGAFRDDLRGLGNQAFRRRPDGVRMIIDFGAE